MKNIFYKAMPLCMLLTLGACSSDDEVFEEKPGVEVPADGEFKLYTFSMSPKEGGSFAGMSKDSRAPKSYEAGWENGWSTIDESSTAYSPSQKYPFNVVYAFVKPTGDNTTWKERGEKYKKPLQFNLDWTLAEDGEEISELKLYYAVKGNKVTIKDAFGTVYTTDAPGFDLTFCSLDQETYESFVHPYLTTPNGNPVLAPVGDILFRSADYHTDMASDKFAITEKSGDISSVKDHIMLDRNTCSFNSKLIFTNFDYTRDGSFISGGDGEVGDIEKPNCHFHNCLEEFFENLFQEIKKHKPNFGWGGHCGDDHFDFDDFDWDCDLDEDDLEGLDWCDLGDDGIEFDYCCNLNHLRTTNDFFKEAKTKGHLTCKTWLTHTHSMSAKRVSKADADDLIELIFKNIAGDKGHRQITWKKLKERIAQIKKDHKGTVDEHQRQQMGDLAKWEISTFIAPNRTHQEALPYPSKYDMFGYDKHSPFGMPVYEQESEYNIVALTKKPRAFVDGLGFIGKPNNYPIDSEYKGVGKDFNYKVSPYIFPIWNDGRYDLCFSIKQTLENGTVKTGTLRFPIENRDYNGQGDFTGPMNQDVYMYHNNSLHSTYIIDFNDFYKKWATVEAKQIPRGAAANVVDLEENVLDVSYQVFNNK